MSSVLVRLSIASVCLLSFTTPSHSDGGLSLIGLWATPENRSHIDIQVCDNNPDMLCGRVAWMLEEFSDDGTPFVDGLNDDPALRNRLLLGIEMLWIEPERKANRWSGEVYDPESGNVYKAKVSLEEQSALTFEGCVLFFCRQQSWPRVTDETSRVHLERFD